MFFVHCEQFCKVNQVRYSRNNTPYVPFSDSGHLLRSELAGRHFRPEVQVALTAGAPGVTW